VAGKALTEIAGEFGLQVATLRTQLSSILKKVGAKRQSDLIRNFANAGIGVAAGEYGSATARSTKLWRFNPTYDTLHQPEFEKSSKNGWASAQAPAGREICMPYQGGKDSVPDTPEAGRMRKFATGDRCPLSRC
jgi:hypothetical protein